MPHWPSHPHGVAQEASLHCKPAGEGTPVPSGVCCSTGAQRGSCCAAEHGNSPCLLGICGANWRRPTPKMLIRLRTFYKLWSTARGWPELAIRNCPATPEKKPCIHQQSLVIASLPLSPWETTNLLSVPMDWPILHLSCKWNPTVM